ncbi:hypothetical protein N7468_001299 [Penicillium chermesinum]|uniref:Uncharacterized protein n=1 Tax=Penicillium chermesinum TaxID=63820 RepID=A0A9W9PGD1_9EURO|nr:uncharacterized protein N7468_001299 [Penicillium chermesinum]KAJ5246316.1 hypothetical protein N7468_001299 [Penicillium chermesinum]
MAIWPFGRRNKRHTIQVSPEDVDTLQASFVEPTLVRKSSRRSPKRHSNRASHSGDGASSPRGVSRSISQRAVSSHESSHEPAAQIEPMHNTEPRPRRPLSEVESLFRNQPQNGPKKLRRRLSKRKAHEIMREREIKALSSTPIDIPYGFDHPRRRTGRRVDRYHSDISLSNRDSIASSLSDSSDNYTFKVNGFAQLTPRPVVRYVEARPPAVRSNTALPAGQINKEKLQSHPASQEDLYFSKRRINELADSLDASSLRELMERDRRRREKQQLLEQEKLRRKLQDRADAQRAEEARRAAEEAQKAAGEQNDVEPTGDDVIMEREEEHMEQNVEEPPAPSAGEARDDSKQTDGVDSMEESARVIGNIDDSSLRAPQLHSQPSFAPSQDMATSRTTLSPTHSLRHGISSPSHSQTFGMGSVSDLSERRPSDTSGRRANGNTITSLFRRGSSRLKKRYRERFHDSSPEPSTKNPSHESFCRIQTQSSPPPTASIIPPRAFIPTGTLKRSRSKFTEHFGDEPMSPPDSRLQSPDIPEEVPESSLEQEQPSTFLHGPTPTTSVDITSPRHRRHQSWTESVDAESDHVPLSQSLASIDSEGSWMSGQFFRRMNKTSSPVRTTMDSFASAEGAVGSVDGSRHSIDSHATGSHGPEETEQEKENDERWHHDVGRRPVLVTPTSRPKSGHAIPKTVPSLSPISAEDDTISEEDGPRSDEASSPQPQRVASMHGVIDHV